MTNNDTVNALISSLKAQRNGALDALAASEANLKVATTEITELKAKVAQLMHELDTNAA